MKFKVGDEVIVCTSLDPKLVGKKAIIYKVDVNDTDLPYLVECNGEEGWVKEDYIRNPTKLDKALK